MPTFEVKTLEAKSVWKSPDGQREIFDVALDYEGSPVTASTYSQDIATVGWAGTVETYEKEGKGGRPAQTFVKQPLKENPGYGSTSGNSSRSSSGYTPKDEKAIQAMWAIGQASQALGNAPIEEVEGRAQELFAMVARVKASEDAPEAPDLDKESDTVVDPDQISMDEIDKIFKKPEDEKPWPSKS